MMENGRAQLRIHTHTHHWVSALRELENCFRSHFQIGRTSISFHYSTPHSATPMMGSSAFMGVAPYEEAERGRKS